MDIFVHSITRICEQRTTVFAREGLNVRVVLMIIYSIFKQKLGICRVRGKKWASDRVGRDNMSHQENMIDFVRTTLKIFVQNDAYSIPRAFFPEKILICHFGFLSEKMLPDIPVCIPDFLFKRASSTPRFYLTMSVIAQ